LMGLRVWTFELVTTRSIEPRTPTPHSTTLTIVSICSAAEFDWELSRPRRRWLAMPECLLNSDYYRARHGSNAADRQYTARISKRSCAGSITRFARARYSTWAFLHDFLTADPRSQEAHGAQPDPGLRGRDQERASSPRQQRAAESESRTNRQEGQRCGPRAMLGQPSITKPATRRSALPVCGSFPSTRGRSPQTRC